MLHLVYEFADANNGVNLSALPWSSSQGRLPSPGSHRTGLVDRTSGSSRYYPKVNSRSCPSETGWHGHVGWRCRHRSDTDTSRSANQAFEYARCIPRILLLAQVPLRLHAVIAAEAFETPRFFKWR